MLESEYFSIVRQLKTRYLERIKELEAEKEIGVKAFDKLQEDCFASEARIKELQSRIDGLTEEWLITFCNVNPLIARDIREKLDGGK